MRIRKKMLIITISIAILVFGTLGVGGYLIFSAYGQICDIYDSGNYLGRGIESIDLISSDGNIDTYRIIFTDKTEHTYTVTNGENGERGFQGLKGDKGDKGDTGLQGLKGDKGDQGAQGIQGIQGLKGDKGDKGETGDAGKSAYEIYVETFGYEGSESDWLYDLINGDLRTVCFTVSFNSGGGSAVDTQTVNTGGKATRPDDPTRDGYIFLGWYLNGEKWNFSSSIVTEDITLTAGWLEI